LNKKLAVIISIILLPILAAVFYGTRTVEPLPVIKNDGVSPSGFAVYTADGDIVYVNQIKAVRKKLWGGYEVKAGSLTIADPVGIIESPPAQSITDIYKQVLDSLDRDTNVLVIYIDGLGYEACSKAANGGTISYISSLGSVFRANTVYPPITDVTFASMVTGMTPKHTGIHDREKKPLAVPTIFDAAAERGKEALLIEGNIRIIIDEAETVLNTDQNKNGTIDDEIYACALQEIKAPPQLLLIHFHSYDDFAHKYGPASEEAMKRLKVLDTYIQDLLKKYDGDVIITADHGMHGTESGGEHGTFSVEDMFIPMIKSTLTGR